MFLITELETKWIWIDNQKTYKTPWLNEWLKLNKMVNMKLSFQWIIFKIVRSHEPSLSLDKMDYERVMSWHDGADLLSMCS